MSVFSKEIGGLVKDMRVCIGESQEQFGKRFGVSHASISDIERGKTTYIHVGIIHLLLQHMGMRDNFIQSFESSENQRRLQELLKKATEITNGLSMKNINVEQLSEEIDIRDKNGNKVYFGDKFIAKMVEPSHEKGTLVTVVKDESEENLACDRNYDVEDKDGNRLWNAYMVIVNGVKVNS